MRTLEEHEENVKAVLVQMRGIAKAIQEKGEIEAFKIMLGSIGEWTATVKDAMTDLQMEIKMDGSNDHEYLNPNFLKFLLERLQKQRLYNKFGI